MQAQFLHCPPTPKAKIIMQEFKVSENYKELKVRFHDTYKIDPTIYPEELVEVIGRYLNSGQSRAVIADDMIRTSNGIVMREIDGKRIWATAYITEIPENWVVEKDEDHPAWHEFSNYLYRGLKSPHAPLKARFHSREMAGNDLTEFQGHQYLTLSQWENLFFTNKKRKSEEPDSDFSNLTTEDWFSIRNYAGHKSIHADDSFIFRGGELVDVEGGPLIVKTHLLFDTADKCVTLLAEMAIPRKGIYLKKLDSRQADNMLLQTIYNLEDLAKQ